MRNYANFNTPPHHIPSTSLRTTLMRDSAKAKRIAGESEVACRSFLPRGAVGKTNAPGHRISSNNAGVLLDLPSPGTQ
jgi:hypothetical protein